MKMTTSQQNYASVIDAAVKLVEPRRTREDVAAALVFEDREGYLAFAAEWKAIYADLSKDIRGYKREMKPAYAGDVSYKGNAQSRRQSCREEARALIEVRKASKLRSGLQREASRTAEAA
jgi:hypothetical protein